MRDDPATDRAVASAPPSADVRRPGAADPAAPWREAVAAIGADIAQPLTGALEHIDALLATGRVDRTALAELRAAVEGARQVGLTAQRLARYASRRGRTAHEPVALAEVLGAVLRHRARPARALGLPLGTGERMAPAEVLADPSLLHGLLDATVDWALRHAGADITFDVGLRTWPSRARLHCRFRLPPPGDAVAAQAAPGASLDSLTWRLLEQIAEAMELVVERHVQGEQVSLTLEFPRTLNQTLEGATSIDLSDEGPFAPSSTPLAGSHVLVVASRRAVRARVRDAIRHLGLAVDLVASVEQAEHFCREALPHAIVVEGILGGDRLARLQSALWAEVPDLAFIEVVEEGDACQMSDAAVGRHMARVGQAVIDAALPSVLLFELSRRL